MCAALGGRAAEKVMFNNISTGALSDLEKVTKQARSMVTVYGLNEKIGNLTYYDSSGQNDYGFTKPYSDVTAQIIDKEISNIILFDLRNFARLWNLVLVGDPGRAYFPKKCGKKLAQYPVETPIYLEEQNITETTIWQIVPMP